MPARLYSHDKVIAKLAEVFREHGYEGTSLAHISEATGLGKGSLYHAFPNGKADMAEAVLDEINAWFVDNVFRALGDSSCDAGDAILEMLDACDRYFCGGGRVCLVGVFALSDTRDLFHVAVNGYFLRWFEALHAALVRAGLNQHKGRELAEDILSGVQGGLVIARALDDTGCFTRELARIKGRVQSHLSEVMVS